MSHSANTVRGNLNTSLSSAGNLNTSLSSARYAFGYGEYAPHYLGAIAYRFNRRFDLHALPTGKWAHRVGPSR